MEIEIQVPLGAQAGAETALEFAASQDNRVLDDPEPRVHLEGFEGDAAVLAVHFWIDDPHHADLLDIKTAFKQRAARELEDSGVELSA